MDPSLRGSQGDETLHKDRSRRQHLGVQLEGREKWDGDRLAYVLKMFENMKC